MPHEPVKRRRVWPQASKAKLRMPVSTEQRISVDLSRSASTWRTTMICEDGSASFKLFVCGERGCAAEPCVALLMSLSANSFVRLGVGTFCEWLCESWLSIRGGSA
ncbi:hypothetical protein ACLOJK_037583 [Asimina triloba]